MSDRAIQKVIIQAAPAGGGQYKELVWKKVKIRKSLDEICHSMELELPVSERNKIHKHDKVEVRYFNKYINDSDSKRRVTTIMVDEITDITDTTKKGLLVVGRSPARDIIDSSWSDVMILQQNLEELARDIAKKFGIDVIRMPTNSPETGPVFTFSWENESPWVKLLNEAANQGFIFTSNEAGNLYLWKVAAGLRDEGFSLSEGSNVRNIQTTENGAEQFHEYVAKAAFKTARITDPTCKNHRLMTINITDENISQEALERRVLTEMRRRRDNRTLVTVSGWGLSDSQIQALGETYHREVFWNPNFLTPVNIPSSGLRGNLLVSEVEYEADKSSMASNLTLVKPEAYK
jgi:prophage tail gpP-like protein